MAKGLEIEEDPTYQRRMWKAERTAWGITAALVLAALLGLFGAGPLSDARASTANGSLRVDYARLARLSAPIRLRIRAPGADAHRIRLSREYLDGVRVESILPPPQHVEASADALLYVFRGTPVDVTFHLIPQRAGRRRGWVDLDSGERLHFLSFVYP